MCAKQCDSEREVAHGSSFVASNGDSHLASQWKNSEGVKIREIREIRVGKQNLREEKNS